jgi:hypothetical protein
MKFICFVCLILFSFSNYSQYTEIATLEFQQFNGETKQNTNYNTTIFNTGLLVGFNINPEKTTQVFFRANYQQRIIEGPNSLHLYKPELITAISNNFSDSWKAQGFILARLASNFHDISGEHYQFGGGSLVTYKSSESLSYKFGAYARKQPNGVLAFPFLGIDYKFGEERWQANVLLPQYAYLKYTIKDSSWYAGLRLNYVTEQYRTLRDKSSLNYAELTEFTSEFFVEYHLTKGLVIYGRAGFLNYQKYELYNEDDILLNLSAREVKNVITGRLGIAYRIFN